MDEFIKLINDREWNRLISQTPRPKSRMGTESGFVIDSLDFFEYNTESKPVYSTVRSKSKPINQDEYE